MSNAQTLILINGSFGVHSRHINLLGDFRRFFIHGLSTLQLDVQLAHKIHMMPAGWTNG